VPDGAAIGFELAPQSGFRWIGVLPMTSGQVGPKSWLRPKAVARMRCPFAVPGSQALSADLGL
jgi:hypothetical protein